MVFTGDLLEVPQHLSYDSADALDTQRAGPGAESNVPPSADVALLNDMFYLTHSSSLLSTSLALRLRSPQESFPSRSFFA